MPRSAAPSWLVDSARFATFVSELQRALASMGAPARGGALAPLFSADSHALSNRLQGIVSSLRATDLRGLLSRMSSHSLPIGASDLAPLVGQLRAAFRSRVLETLGDNKVRALQSLMRLAAPNLLAVVRCEESENAHSNVLAWLLNPRTAPTIARGALHRLVQGLEQPEIWQARVGRALNDDSLSVRREVRLSRELGDQCGEDRIDILIAGPDFLLAIENKIWSFEHDEQTVTYWEWLRQLPAYIVRAGFFLSPSGAPAICSSFKAISYLELLSCLLEAHANESVPENEQTVLAGYVKTLAASVLRQELRILSSSEEAR